MPAADPDLTEPDLDEGFGLSPRTRLTVELVIVALGTLLVASLLHPDLWFVNTLPAGGDLSSHVWGADALRRTILPAPSGWSWDWFAGFPAFVLYPVLPFLGIVALHLVLPYGVAMKLVIVAGLVLLPVVAWTFGRLWRLPFPAPALLSVASVGFLLQTHADRTGGNLESTIRGEFAYTLGLTAAVLALGLMGAAATRGRYRVLTPIAVAVAALCHPLTGELVVVGGLAILGVAAIDHGADAFRRLGPPVAVGLALTGFWWLPFVADRSWMTSPQLRRTTGFHALLPYGVFELVLIPLAVVGVALAWQERRRLVGALAGIAVFHALLYLILPVGQLENLRVVSFWAWPRLALAAIGVAELLPSVVERWPSRRPTLAVAVPAAVALAVLVPTAVIWHAPPIGNVNGRPYGVAALGAMEGYQRNPAYPTYKGLMDTMAKIGRDRGCGRFLWSVDERPGGSDAGIVSNDLAPFWTKGCIQSVPGLYLDSSSTTPFEQLTETMTGIASDPFVPGLPYRGDDLTDGVKHLRWLGVRYFATQGSSLAKTADASSDLTPLATSGTWHVYEVKDSPLVSTIPVAPVVLKVPGLSWSKGWVQYTEGSRPWDTQPLAQDGPDDWSRLEGQTGAKAVPLPSVHVSGIRLTDHGLRFHVNQTGVPVVVHASYFPGWKVDGGTGPYRLEGNMMAVIPTSNDVSMHQSKGPIGLFGELVSLAGLAGLILLAQRTWEDRHPRPDG